MKKIIKTTYIVLLVLIFTISGIKAREIHNAAAVGDLDKVKALLYADPTLLELKGDYNNTPLISACWGPPVCITQEEVANYLIDKGADIHAKNEFGATALYFCVNNYELAKRLISMGADVNVIAFGNISVLSQAADAGNHKLIDLLIAHGAELNYRSVNGTILHRIIVENSDSCVGIAESLIKGGIKLQEFSFGNNELHMVAMKGLSDLVQILVEYGINVNDVNDYGHTPLYYATMHGHKKTADALIKAGADKSAIVETNYGKAPQLSINMQEGEAYTWFMGGLPPPGLGYAVKTKNNLVVFDPPVIDESLENGICKGILNPIELSDQKISFFITRENRFGPTLHGPNISDLAKLFPNANFVLSFEPIVDKGGKSTLPTYKLVMPNENFSKGGIKAQTILANCNHYIIKEDYGLGYLVDVDGVKVFHAGLHSSRNSPDQLEKYEKEIDFLKPFGPIDFAILPITGCHMFTDYEPYLYMIDQLNPKAIYLIGDNWNTEEHLKCIEVLKARDIPVYYPDGGIATGQRFHYIRH